MVLLEKTAMLISKVRETDWAGSQSSFPSCVACSVHVPLSRTEMVKPFTAHEPLAARLTGSPELAVGATSNDSAWPVVRLLIWPKVISWVAAARAGVGKRSAAITRITKRDFMSTIQI